MLQCILEIGAEPKCQLILVCNIQCKEVCDVAVVPLGWKWALCLCESVCCVSSYLQVVLAVQLNSFLLRMPTGAILQRGEHSGGNVYVVTLHTTFNHS